jgi:DNA (cytosine-5)-methyltransferase 1
MDYLTVSEAAEKIGVSSDTIRRWDRKDIIKSSRNSKGYRVFSLQELKRIKRKKNGDDKNRYKIWKSPERSRYTVVDLFSGAGGTALGLENAGLNHVMLVENNKDAIATLGRNRPDWNVVGKDVQDVDYSGIKADVVEGGFPCQSFSYAGKKKGFADTRGTLFFEFARAIKEINPKVAIGENVKGLLRHDQGKTLFTMIKTLKELGYKVTYKILRAQYFDVPQKRERLIILAVRKDLDIDIIFPKEKNYIISIREALRKVPPSKGYTYSKKKKEIMALVPPGGYWRDLPEDIQREYMGASFYHSGGKTGMARRLSWDEPCLTLTTSPSQKQTERCHPEETRPLTIREYARIQTFPDDWCFEGSLSSQYRQIGNAVPVNLGYHLGRTVTNMLEGSYNKNNYIEADEDFFRFQSPQLKLLESL